MPLKHISIFFRVLEIPLINTKLYSELNWTEHSIISNANTATTFQITKNELYVPVVTLSTENNNKLTNLLSEGFKRSVIRNEYKTKIETVRQNDNNFKRTLLDASYSGVNRLFAMGFNNSNIKRNSNDPLSHRRYYLLRMEIKDYNVLIDGRNFYDQNINNSITRHNELLKLTTGKSEDYTTGCLTDYDWYIKDFNIDAVDLSHQAVLDSDPKAIQEIEFIYKLTNGTEQQILPVLEKEKETILEFSKGTVKVY